MNILLDTHSFIWLDINPSQLSHIAHSVIADKQNTLFLSVVSIWEIQIKLQIGKLTLNNTAADTLAQQQKTNRIQLLNIELPHVLKVGELPLHHKDPFDRLLIAQAMVEGYTLLGKDEIFKSYSVSVLW